MESAIDLVDPAPASPQSEHSSWQSEPDLDESDMYSGVGSEQQSNGLKAEGPPWGLEHVYDYEAGGHHPLHLGDFVDADRRYRVMHKLGSGGLAIVWLCRDTHHAASPEYVAVKVLMAEASTDDCPELLRTVRLGALSSEPVVDGVCLPLRTHFRVEGPNGSHLCFVYPVLGPKVSLGLLPDSEDADGMLRRICSKVIVALSWLHSHGVCHGGRY